MNRSLSLTFGCRWEDYGQPYEAHGLQSTSTVPLTQYFNERTSLQSQGVPQNTMPNATLSWALDGPGNGKPTWWKPSNLNFGPRFGLAYAPTGRGGWLAKLFGKRQTFPARPPPSSNPLFSSLSTHTT